MPAAGKLRSLQQSGAQDIRFCTSHPVQFLQIHCACVSSLT